MRAIVVGCGRVGRELALGLQEVGHEVCVLDKNESAFHRLPDTFEGTTVQGIGFDRHDLERAGIKEAEAFAAVTSGDNTNIIAARIAKETYRIPNVVARIYDPRRAKVYERLGISTVATVAWATDQILRKLLPDSRPAEWTDPSGMVHLVKVELPAEWAGHRLMTLERPQWRIVALSRAGSTVLVDESTVGQDGDELHIAVVKGAKEAFKALLAEGGGK